MLITTGSGTGGVNVEDSFSLGTAVHEIVKEEVTKAFDADTDGIRNQLDDCSGTLAAFSVDKTGCEVSYTMPTPFKVGSAVIEPELLQPTVQQLAAYLQANPNKTAQIQGHADATGSEEFNKILSEKRAKFVMNKLIEFGVSPQRLSSVGFGEKRPLASNHSPLGRQKNRRVEAEFKD